MNKAIVDLLKPDARGWQIGLKTPNSTIRLKQLSVPAIFRPMQSVNALKMLTAQTKPGHPPWYWHKFGHGKQHISSLPATLNILAFLFHIKQLPFIVVVVVVSSTVLVYLRNSDSRVQASQSERSRPLSTLLRGPYCIQTKPPDRIQVITPPQTPIDGGYHGL